MKLDPMKIEKFYPRRTPRNDGKLYWYADGCIDWEWVAHRRETHGPLPLTDWYGHADAWGADKIEQQLALCVQGQVVLNLHKFPRKKSYIRFYFDTLSDVVHLRLADPVFEFDFYEGREP